VHEGRGQDLGGTVPETGEDSLDESPLPGPDADEDEAGYPAPPYTGYELYDADEEALKW